MQLHQLRYALAVARERSFRRAAESIPVSVASVSEAVKALETELGVTLFVRTMRSVRPTSAGLLFIEQASKVLSDLDAMQTQLAAYRGVLGSVILGAPTNVHFINLTVFIAGFCRAHPGIQLHLVEAPSRQLVQSLRSREIDIAFVTGPQDWLPTDIVGEELRRDETVVALAPSNPLANRGVVSLSDLADMPMIAFPPGYAHREIANELSERTDFRPRIAFETSVTNILCGLVRADLGFALLPLYRAIANSLSFVRCVPTPVGRVMHLVWLKDRQIPPEAALLRDEILRVADWISK